MRSHLIAAALAGLFAVTPVLAQTTTPAAEKAETNCNMSPPTTAGAAGKPADTSMAMEKSAILPSAGGAASSAAPTVQSDGKAMQVRPDCPPDSKK